MNTGDVTLTGFDGSRTLRPGEAADIVRDHVVTEVDLASGSITSAAQYWARTPSGAVYETPVVTFELPVPGEQPVQQEHPELAGRVAGSLDLAPGERPRIGTRVTWTVTVTNTGDVELQDVRLRGGKERVFLAPGETRTLTRSTTLSAHDLETRRVSSITQVSGRTPEGALVHLEVRGARLIRLP
ncbi:hypothetical protein C1I64_18285 [Rathayibacter festucae DSM 15932]|uniref:DUF7507 domain-containing protein n=1 Tax=Rathayibacter festucae DSM 15932 TaxID=1328866 RepID=A0A3Q9UTJ5_9MICO|nr:hypothetical protein C1I64_18285 [Rathayibacter festucae DSM 15932]